MDSDYVYASGSLLPEEKQEAGASSDGCTILTASTSTGGLNIKLAAGDDDNTTIDTCTIVDSPALVPDMWADTPTTVLTASPTVLTSGSLDEGSLNEEKQHQRVLSWDGVPFDSSFSGTGLPPSLATNVWGNKPAIASFRENEERPYRNNTENRWLQPPKLFYREDAPSSGAQRGNAIPFLPARGGVSYHRPAHPAGGPHNKVYNQPPLHPVGRNQGSFRSPLQVPRNTGRGAPVSPSSSRSSSEVLKTLLRKKACLYEPDTSRAVALVTWLVGRELALEYGFFSRQQLQAGVHRCVADKIESGVITRTKVNRCMQIILNSCFHYIIPRPDGTEENGDIFKGLFAREMRDDRELLQLLPRPWNSIRVDRDDVVASSLEELEKKGIRMPPNATPPPSPKLQAEPSPDDDESDAKRAVLLCFNENVRSATDVFRCHNEFIRDTAHASNLQLSADEWQHFFGRDAANARHVWGNVGIPVPYKESHYGYMDALGMLADKELGVLRTFWCAKRYEHNHELCAFAHVETNGGWLRRNPLRKTYRDELCPRVKIVDLNGRRIMVNDCPHGTSCEFAHSTEEVVYHPNRYKSRPCSQLKRASGCPTGDMCPDFHPVDTYRFPRRADGRHGKQHPNKPNSHDAEKLYPVVPNGAPTLYVNPAPVSSFEQHMFVPGLQQQYRRHCAVVRAGLLSRNCNCHYSYFGEDLDEPIRQLEQPCQDAHVIHRR